jgi:hypothetical protein
MKTRTESGGIMCCLILAFVLLVRGMKDDSTGSDCLVLLPNLNACVILLRAESDSVVILHNPKACVTLLGLR